MSKLSYSFHISNGKSAINNAKNLERAFKHNLRSYKSEKRNKDINDTLIGEKSVREALNEFRAILEHETKEYVEEYNKTKTKTRDKIIDYFEKCSNDKKTELATEIIIQVGDMDYWKDKSLEEKKKMNLIFKNQIKKLEEYCPNFKIVNATVHYDEASPHMQIIGIPLADYDKGLKRRIAKTKVFTKESLEKLQDTMRMDLNKQMQRLYGQGIELKEKEQGRNKDLVIEKYIEMQEKLQKETHKEIETELKKINIITEKNEYLKNRKNKKKELEEKLEEIEKNKGLFSNKKALEISQKQVLDLSNELLNEKDKNQELYENYKKLKKTIENQSFFNKEKYKTLVRENEELKKQNKALNEALELIIKRIPDLFKALAKDIVTICIKFNSPWDNNKKKEEIEKSDIKYGLKNSTKEKSKNWFER